MRILSFEDCDFSDRLAEKGIKGKKSGALGGASVDYSCPQFLQHLPAMELG
jgi:hypothetical protein